MRLQPTFCQCIQHSFLLQVLSELLPFAVIALSKKVVTSVHSHHPSPSEHFPEGRQHTVCAMVQRSGAKMALSVSMNFITAIETGL